MNSTLQQRTKTVVAAIAIAGLAVVGMDAYTCAPVDSNAKSGTGLAMTGSGIVNRPASGWLGLSPDARLQER